jgi:flagellar biosynthetic protein FlhB
MSGGWFASSKAQQLRPFIAAPHTMLGGLEAGAGVEIGIMAV